MENLTTWEICVATVGGLLALAAAINTLGAAWEKISKARKAVKAPNNAQDERLDRLEKDMEKAMEFLGNDKRHLAVLDEGNKVTQRAMLALLAHGIDGNNVHQLEKAKADLEEYLINR